MSQERNLVCTMSESTGRVCTTVPVSMNRNLFYSFSRTQRFRTCSWMSTKGVKQVHKEQPLLASAWIFELECGSPQPKDTFFCSGDRQREEQEGQEERLRGQGRRFQAGCHRVSEGVESAHRALCELGAHPCVAAASAPIVEVLPLRISWRARFVHFRLPCQRGQGPSLC